MVFCTLFNVSIVYIGTQTDFDEPTKYCDAGVQCEIGPIGYQRSSTPDIEPIQCMSMTDDESININQEIS